MRDEKGPQHSSGYKRSCYYGQSKCILTQRPVESAAIAQDGNPRHRAPPRDISFTNFAAVPARMGSRCKVGRSADASGNKTQEKGEHTGSRGINERHTSHQHGKEYAHSERQ